MEQSEQQKAEATVRTQIPELMELSFGCRVVVKDGHHGDDKYSSDNASILWKTGRKEGSYMVLHDGSLNSLTFQWADNLEIIGHPIQLQHWLRVLRMKNGIEAVGNGTTDPQDTDHIVVTAGEYKTIVFDLTTGQPATEADYKAFNEVVGI